jgi:hypothetical protein
MAADYPYSPQIIRGTISSGGSVSSVYDLMGYSLIGVVMPGSFTGTNISVYVAAASAGTEGTFQQAFTPTGGTVSFVGGPTGVGTTRAIALNTDLAPFRYVKFVNASGTLTADKEILVLAK